MRRLLPTQERLRALFSYEDGRLYWLVSINNRAPVGSEAGCVTTGGYRQVRIGGVIYKTHRLIWKLKTGEEPPEYLDHVDGDPSNNRIENLAPISNRANTCKGRKHTEKRSGLPVGVYKQPKSKPYYAMIYTDGKNRRLGSFGTIEEAAKAYNDALLHHSRLHG